MPIILPNSWSLHLNVAYSGQMAFPWLKVTTLDPGFVGS